MTRKHNKNRFPKNTDGLEKKVGFHYNGNDHVVTDDDGSGGFLPMSSQIILDVSNFAIVKQ